jgi:hypothetical protein
MYCSYKFFYSVEDPTKRLFWAPAQEEIFSWIFLLTIHCLPCKQENVEKSTDFLHTIEQFAMHCFPLKRNFLKINKRLQVFFEIHFQNHFIIYSTYEYL